MYLIIGTGFVSTLIYREIQKKGIKVIVLEPTLENELPLNFQAVDGSVFDPIKANKNATYGGGTKTWGNGLTLPTRESYFSNQNFKTWRMIENVSLNEKFLSLIFNIESDSFELNRAESRLVNKYLPEIDGTFRVEKHAYAGRSPFKNGWKLQINPLEVLRGIVIKIEKLSGEKGYSISYRDHKRNIQEVQANKVIFASGTLMNAALVSLLASKTLFPIGNHATLKVFSLRFRRMQSLGNLIQSYSKMSSSFLSFTYPKDKSKLNQDSPEVSIRVNYKDKESMRKIFNLSSRNMGDKFEIFARFIAEKFLKKHLYRIVSIVAWIEIQIEASNFMRIEKVENGIFQITIRLVPSKVVRSQIHTAQYEFQKHLAKSRFSFSLVDKYQEDNYLTHLVDTAHYFGTVPMHQFEACKSTVENSLYCTVSKNFELNEHPGVYVIGNSSIPQGGHGHPTAMTVSLANVFVESTLIANNA